MIRVITEPSVYLIADTFVFDSELNLFLNDNGSSGWESSTSVATQVIAEVAGRLCYDSFKAPRPGGNGVYLRHILESGHGSVLEHATFTFILTGVSRSLTHELVRHRAGMAYSQRSQRYVDESEVAFVLPPMLLPAYAPPGQRTFDSPLNPAAPEDLRVALEDWWYECHSARVAYGGIVDNLSRYVGAEHPDLSATDRRKAAREAARSVLPNCTETRIQVTGNARAWRNFIEQRGAKKGPDAEIRRLALAVHARLNEAAPNIFGDYEVKLIDGITYLETPYRKV